MPDSSAGNLVGKCLNLVWSFQSLSDLVWPHHFWSDFVWPCQSLSDPEVTSSVLTPCLTLCDVLSPYLTLCDLVSHCLTLRWPRHNLSDLVWHSSPCLTLCDLVSHIMTLRWPRHILPDLVWHFGPYLTLCDLITSDMTLQDVWLWGDLATLCLTMCDLFSPYLTLCDMSLLVWACVTLSIPIWPCVTSSLLVWPCVTSSVAAWSSVTLSFRDLVWPCHSLSDLVWPISLPDLVWSFQHLSDLLGGGAVVWRAFLEAAVLDVAARLPQHHRDVSGRRPAVPPASTAPCSASEAGRCHGSWPRRVAPCPRGWGPSPRTAFYRPHRPRESLGACYGSADLVVSLPRRRPGPAETRATTVESRRYGTLHAAAHNRLQDSEVARLQCEMDRRKRQHTTNILDSMPPWGAQEGRCADAAV